MRVSCFQARWVFLSLLTAVLGQQDGVQTIFNNPTFSRLRPCVQGCFYIQGGSPVTYLRDVLGSKMGCPMAKTTSITSIQAAENDCFCRADLQPSAQAILTRCIMSRCSQNENDAVTAGAMYGGYCSNLGRAPAGDGGDQATATGAPSRATNGGDGAFPGAAPTAGQSSPTGSPGTSFPSSGQKERPAALVLWLASMVSC